VFVKYIGDTNCLSVFIGVIDNIYEVKK